jgi:hypothetical protein
MGEERSFPECPSRFAFLTVHHRFSLVPFSVFPGDASCQKGKNNQPVMNSDNR